jgi:hypothetical protein
MPIRKKSAPDTEQMLTISLPASSDLPERLRRLSEATGAEPRDLIAKWLDLEEKLFSLQRSFQEVIFSRWQLNIEAQAAELSKQFLQSDDAAFNERKIKPQKKPVSPKTKTRAAAPEDILRETILKEVDALKAQGMTLQAIAQSLNTNHVPTPSGKGGWHASTLSRFLSKSKKLK